MILLLFLLLSPVDGRKWMWTIRSYIVSFVCSCSLDCVPKKKECAKKERVCRESKGSCLECVECVKCAVSSVPSVKCAESKGSSSASSARCDCMAGGLAK